MTGLRMVVWSMAAAVTGGVLSWGAAHTSPHEGPVPSEHYRESWPDGSWLDGRDGHLGTIGRIRLTQPVEAGTYRYRVSRDAAIEEARRNLRRTAPALLIDGTRRLADEPVLLERVRRLIDALEPRNERIGRGRFFEVEIRLPIRGLSGVLGMILEWGGTPPPASPAGDVDAATGLVIDMSHLVEESQRPSVSLLPRILDEDGRVVYSIDLIDHDQARERGLVAWMMPGQEDSAEETASLIGDRPMWIRGVATGGDHRADLVIGNDDAGRVRSLGERSSILQECRVMVIMPRPPMKSATPAERPTPERPHQDPNRLH